jgi:hypothetical protein
MLVRLAFDVALLHLRRVGERHEDPINPAEDRLRRRAALAGLLGFFCSAPIWIGVWGQNVTAAASATVTGLVASFATKTWFSRRNRRGH